MVIYIDFFPMHHLQVPGGDGTVRRGQSTSEPMPGVPTEEVPPNGHE